MGLDFVKRTYEKWGSVDPMYAVLTRHDRAGSRWDTGEFFHHGRQEVAAVAADLEALGIRLCGRALDFGCGVGRLSQALAEHVDEVLGVDIAKSMVEAARSHNSHPDRVRYLVNSRPDLAILDDASFDFVYSNITLQHIPPRYARTYICEFFRVVRPGGCVLFQMRSGPRIRPGSLRAFLYRLNREHVRHILQRLRGRPPYEIHFIAREQVEQLIADAGGRLVDVAEVGGRRRRNYRYCAIRPAGPAPTTASAGAPR